MSAIVDGIVAAMKSIFSPSKAIQVGSFTFTAAQLEAATGSLGSFLDAFQAALKAKNYDAATEIAVDEALIIAGDIGVPYAGLAAKVLPFLYAQGSKNLGLTPAEASIFPSTHSPNDRTDGIWPTTLGNDN